MGPEARGGVGLPLTSVEGGGGVCLADPPSLTCAPSAFPPVHLSLTRDRETGETWSGS